MVSWFASLRPQSISFRMPPALTVRHVLYGILIGFSLSITSTSLALYFQQRKRERLQDRFEPRPIEIRSDEIVDGVTGLIGRMYNVRRVHALADSCPGNTPLVRIKSLSDALGVEILGKAEVDTFP